MSVGSNKLGNPSRPYLRFSHISLQVGAVYFYLKQCVAPYSTLYSPEKNVVLLTFSMVSSTTFAAPSLIGSYLYKVVQLWPGQSVTCLHTNSPGHIWTTLYVFRTLLALFFLSFFLSFIPSFLPFFFSVFLSPMDVLSHSVVLLLSFAPHTSICRVVNSVNGCAVMYRLYMKHNAGKTSAVTHA